MPRKTCGYASRMRAVLWWVLVPVWLVALLIGLVNEDTLPVTFPLVMGSALVLTLLCYGVRHTILTVVPAIAVLVAIGFLFHVAGLPSWLWLGVIPFVVAFGLPRFERVLERRGLVTPH
jgi:hypothetical protein